MRVISRRFPDYGWAWPTGELDRLLKAVLLPDEVLAIQLASDYLDENDIDNVPSREHRLLVAVAARFGNKLAAHSAYVRLAGMQKMMWTKSRLAAHEAMPALKAMANDGCDILLLKGAARIAIDPSAQRGRVAHDIDILVRPKDIGVAFQVLSSSGWVASTGASPQYVRSRLSELHSLNFFKGLFGDIDLHQKAYNFSQPNAEDDLALWDRARPARFGGVEVLVPSPADRIALAIAHGGLDAHSHSDWLVDCAVAIEAGDVDWRQFLSVVQKRGIAVSAAAGLTYLGTELGVPIPKEHLREVVAMADGHGFSRWSSLVQAKPRGDFGPLSWLSRGLAKQFRLRKRRSARQERQPDLVWSGSHVVRSPAPTMEAPALSTKIAIPADMAGKPLRLDLVVRVNLPPVQRRIEMEINAGERHVARLRYRVLYRSKGSRLLRFHGTITPEVGEIDFTLEARPARQFRDWSNQWVVAKYGALPVQMVSAKISPAG